MGPTLLKLLLAKGYEVHGILRKASTFNTHRVSHLYIDPHRGDVTFFIHYGDLADSGQISHLIYSLQPDNLPSGRSEPCPGQF